MPVFLLEQVTQAYLDCRKSKRSSQSALEFEIELERNLVKLRDELADGSYRIGTSTCFIITHPRPREVWAGRFRDRIVHHLLYNYLAPRFEPTFFADTCACIPGRGTLYGANRLEAKIRSATQNWSTACHYLKIDIQNFFVKIDKEILFSLLEKRISDPWWLALTRQVLFHDPRQDFRYHGSPALQHKVPEYKRLGNQPARLGLPIGNLSSQFFANVYLNQLDQFIKHGLKVRHYIRYVDDMVILHPCPAELNRLRREIDSFLADHLGIQLNPKKTIIQPGARGIDFVGQVIRPWHRVIRKKTADHAMARIKTLAPQALTKTANSYFGLFRQATHSHHHRALLARSLLRRGKTINQHLTKTYRSAGEQ